MLWALQIIFPTDLLTYLWNSATIPPQGGNLTRILIGSTWGIELWLIVLSCYSSENLHMDIYNSVNYNSTYARKNSKMET